MDIYDYAGREVALNSLRASVEAATPERSRRLRTRLTAEENLLYDETESLPFNDGSWYRPDHNTIVPAVMITFCDREGLDRKVMVPAAELHDNGYSRVEVAYRDADWGSKEKRIKHMKFGAQMATELLIKLNFDRKISFTREQIDSIVDIIANHDNCYIGKPYTSEEQKNHLDADRIYVMAFSSFYKDFFNYLDKGTFKDADDFLLTRVASYFSDPDDNPIQDTHPLDPERQRQDEGPHRLPLRLGTARLISSDQFLQRREELGYGILELNEDDFSRYCRERLEKEADLLLPLP